MQETSRISSDGLYWWDGQEWQPIPAAPPRPAVPPAGGPPTPPPLIARASPRVSPAAPWERPPRGRDVLTTIALWCGVIAGAALVFLGLLGIRVANSAPIDEQSVDHNVAMLILVVGALIFVPTFVEVVGFGRILSFPGTATDELGLVGTIVTVLMILGTILILTSPVGTFRYGIPMGGAIMIVRRALQAKWVAAGTIGAVWAVGATAALATGH